MGWKNRKVSLNAGTFFIAVCALAGLALGLIPGNGWSLVLLTLLSGGVVFYYRTPGRNGSDVEAVGVLGLFAATATALGTTGAGYFMTTPGVPLAAFWLYTLVATGFMVSRCCLGWHVGASAAVLTAFVAVGLFVQSFYSAGPGWVVALILAAGLWWGADSWRRANGLAINE